MPDESARAINRPPVRRSVQWIAVATLGGALLLDVLGPQVYAGEKYAAPAPLLAQTGWESGGIGGALPDVVLTHGGRFVRARDLRPAVLLLVSPECRCIDEIRHVVAQTDGSGIRVYVVGAAGRRQVQLIAAQARGDAVPLLDQPGGLHDHYTAAGQQLLLVREDGIVVDIIDEVDRDVPLRSMLPALLKAPGQMGSR